MNQRIGQAGPALDLARGTFRSSHGNGNGAATAAAKATEREDSGA